VTNPIQELQALARAAQLGEPLPPEVNNLLEHVEQVQEYCLRMTDSASVTNRGVAADVLNLLHGKEETEHWWSEIYQQHIHEIKSRQRLLLSLD
jgi:hypothetical protein